MTHKEKIIETMRLSGRPNLAWLQMKLKVSFEEAQKICHDVFSVKENVDE